jgi:hypothetical protein
MSQNGPDKGMGSDMYPRAWAFLKKRELRGIDSPQGARKKTTTTGAGAADRDDVDISDVRLEGELDDRVPVFGMYSTRMSGTVSPSPPTIPLPLSPIPFRRYSNKSPCHSERR